MDDGSQTPIYSTAWAKPKIQVSTRFTPDMAERLRVLAYSCGITKTHLIQFAVERYIDAVERKEADNAKR